MTGISNIMLNTTPFKNWNGETPLRPIKCPHSSGLIQGTQFVLGYTGSLKCTSRMCFYGWLWTSGVHLPSIFPDIWVEIYHPRWEKRKEITLRTLSISCRNYGQSKPNLQKQWPALTSRHSSLMYQSQKPRTYSWVLMNVLINNHSLHNRITLDATDITLALFCAKCGSSRQPCEMFRFSTSSKLYPRSEISGALYRSPQLANKDSRPVSMQRGGSWCILTECSWAWLTWRWAATVKFS